MLKSSSEGTESTRVERLLRENAEQAAEIERLRAQLVDDEARTSRRGLLKGLGLTSLIAVGAGAGMLSGADGAMATPSGVTENSELAGEDVAFLELRLNGSLVLGPSVRDGVEDQIEIFYYRQMRASASGSGQAGGRGQSGQSIVIRKHIDKASPFLLRGMANNQLAEGTFRFRRSIEGESSFYYIVSFRGQVVDVEQYLPEALQTEGKVRVGVLEQVSFSVQQLTVRYDDGEAVTI